MSDDQPAREPAMSTTATITAKEEVMEFIRDLPDDFTFDDIMQELYVLERIRTSEQDIQEGRFFTDEQFKERFKQWLTP